MSKTRIKNYLKISQQLKYLVWSVLSLVSPVHMIHYLIIQSFSLLFCPHSFTILLNCWWKELGSRNSNVNFQVSFSPIVLGPFIRRNFSLFHIFGLEYVCFWFSCKVFFTHNISELEHWTEYLIIYQTK